MGGMWRKIGGVFLEFEGESPDAKPTGKRKETGEASLGEIAGDADALLAQLEGRKQSTSRPRRARAPAAAAAPSRAAAPAAAPAARVDVLKMDTGAVYAAARLADGPNSADRILKMISGLANFPPEQQRAMIQALDTADPSWTEGEVLEDARARQSALRGHLRAIEQEKNARTAALAARVREVEATGRANLAEIDKQLAELQKLREQQVGSTAAQLEKLQNENASVLAGGEDARKSITDEINRLSGLMTFFTGGASA